MQARHMWMERGAEAASVGLTQLEADIRTLINLETTESPVLSCYVSRDGAANGTLRAVERRARALRENFRDDDREPFEGALGRIKTFLTDELHATTRGVAAFSRVGSRPFFLGLQFQVPLRSGLSFDSTPSICNLLEIKDTHHRYIVLIATDVWTRIIEISLGAIAVELWTPRPVLCRRVDPAWAQKAYPSRSRERGERCLKETIDVLELFISSRKHSHLVLAGSPQLTERLRNGLPNHVAAKIIDIVPASASARVGDVVAAARSSFSEREQEESRERVAQLVSGLRRGGLAAAGTRPTLEALRRGDADVLVMAKAYPSSRGWGCKTCGFVAAGPVRPARCPECESVNFRPLDLKEEIVRLAEKLSAEVEFVSHSDALMDLGGVGCLLHHIASGDDVGAANDHRTSNRVGARLAWVG